MSATETQVNLEAVKAAIKYFEKTQEKYREYGAYDTEPDSIFQNILNKAIDGKDVKIPQTGEGWELYSSSVDCAEAAAALHLAALGAVQAIFACPIRESRAVREYVKDYCWRYN
jgi:hypothetical protein